MIFFSLLKSAEALTDIFMTKGSGSIPRAFDINLTDAKSGDDKRAIYQHDLMDLRFKYSDSRSR